MLSDTFNINVNYMQSLLKKTLVSIFHVSYDSLLTIYILTDQCK